MAIQKSYFILPAIFEHTRDLKDILVPQNHPTINPFTEPRLVFKLVNYKVSGVEKLMNTPVSAGVITYNDLEFDDCNNDMTICNGGGQINSYNPFFNGIRADFPIVDGVARGVSNGTTNAINYGFGDLNFTIDKEQIRDGLGGLRYGSFSIDIDYDYDFFLKIEISVPSSNDIFPYGDSVTFEIEHKAETCSSTFVSKVLGQSGPVTNDWFKYGFLLGEIDQNEADEYHIIPSCFDLVPVNVCEGYKTKGVALFVRLPIELQDPKIKQLCCDKYLVFAEQGPIVTNWKNDFRRIIKKRQTPNDTFDFFLCKCDEDIPINNDDLGTFYDFGDFELYPDYTGFHLDWNKVLNNGNLGVGVYQIKIVSTIGGVESESLSCIYDLRIFTESSANKTVRIVGEMNGYLEHDDINYKDLNWRDCIRVPGSFGRVEFETEEDSLIYNGKREIKQVKINETRQHNFQSHLLNYCMTSQLNNWMFKCNFLLISAFNLYNHKTYRDFEVKIPTEKTLKEFQNNNKAVVEATFPELYDNKRKLNC